MAVLQKLVDAHPADTQVKSDLLWYQNGVGLALAGKGDTKGSLESFRRIARGQEKLAAANPTVPDFQVRLSSTLTNLGKALTTAGSPAEARPPLERAVAILEALVAHPQSALYRGDLADSLTQLAAAVVPLRCPATAVAGLAARPVSWRACRIDPATISSCWPQLTPGLATLPVRKIPRSMPPRNRPRPAKRWSA